MLRFNERAHGDRLGSEWYGFHASRDEKNNSLALQFRAIIPVDLAEVTFCPGPVHLLFRWYTKKKDVRLKVFSTA